MFRITVAGLVLMAVGYLLLGPAPPLQTLLLDGGRPPWLIWVSLSVAGIGAGMAFVPLLPAMLTSLAAVCHQKPGQCSFPEHAKLTTLLRKTLSTGWSHHAGPESASFGSFSGQLLPWGGGWLELHDADLLCGGAA